MVFNKQSEQGYVKMAEGILRKTTIHGDKTMMCEFRLSKGAEIPPHDHPYEQIGYMISGKMQFIIGDGSFLTQPGDSWCIPDNVPHQVEVLEDSIVVEVFSPPREDYLP